MATKTDQNNSQQVLNLLDDIQIQAEVFAWDPVVPAMLEAFPCPAAILATSGHFVAANSLLAEQFGNGNPDFHEGKMIGDVLKCVHTLSAKGGCGKAAPCSECEGISTIHNSAGFNGQCRGEGSIMTHEGSRSYVFTTSPIDFADVRYIILSIQPQ